MRILFTGGGSGGHFYPIIAIIEKIEDITREQKLIAPLLFFASDNPFDKKLLLKHNVTFKHIPAGKIRRYLSLQNFFDLFKTLWGILKALYLVFHIYPDVIFGKGGYASFPVILAGRMFNIPIFIHESDSVPGKVNKWAGHFAERVAISFEEAVKYFGSNKEKVAWTGNPVRTTITKKDGALAAKFLGFDQNLPTILVLGGSQGAEMINNLVLDSLKNILPFTQVIHQTGTNNFKNVSERAFVILEGNEFRNRYKAFDYLDDETLSMSSGLASLVVSRAGSTIFEIASWGIPSIIIPITNSNGNHQRLNAFYYARSGSAVSIEEENISPTIFENEVKRILTNKDLYMRMMESARKFYKPDASRKIAEEIIKIGLAH